MNARLVALDGGPDIVLDRAMVVVGRHPACDARLDSLRVSRHHCCMAPDDRDVLVRDLGSTNGVRINGRRVEIGRLRAGDELGIAHFRYRLEVESGNGWPTTDPARPTTEAECCDGCWVKAVENAPDAIAPHPGTDDVRGDGSGRGYDSDADGPPRPASTARAGGAVE